MNRMLVIALAACLLANSVIAGEGNGDIVDAQAPAKSNSYVTRFTQSLRSINVQNVKEFCNTNKKSLAAVGILAVTSYALLKCTWIRKKLGLHVRSTEQEEFDDAALEDIIFQ